MHPDGATPRQASQWGLHCIAIYAIATFSWGLQGSALGPTTIALAQKVGCKEADFGGLVGLSGICFILSGVVSGWLTEVLPCNSLLGIVLLIQAAVLVTIPQAPTLPALTAAFCALNLTYNTTNAITTAAVAWLYPESNTLWYNILCALFGLGSLLTPLLLTAVPPNPPGCLLVYYLVALATLASALLAFTAPSPGPHTSVEPSLKAAAARACAAPALAGSAPPRVRRAWGVLALLGGMTFLTLSVMSSFGNWVFTYVVQQQQLATFDAALVNSTYWAFLFCGRVLSSLLSLWMGPGMLLYISIPFAIVGPLLPLLLPTHPVPLPLLLLSVAAVGLGNSTGSANSFALAARYIPIDSLVNSFTCVTVGLAATLLPAAMPWLATLTPLGFDILMLITAVASAVHLGLVFVTQVVGAAALRRQLRVAIQSGSLGEEYCALLGGGEGTLGGELGAEFEGACEGSAEAGLPAVCRYAAGATGEGSAEGKDRKAKWKLLGVGGWGRGSGGGALDEPLLGAVFGDDCCDLEVVECAACACGGGGGGGGGGAAAAAAAAAVAAAAAASAGPAAVGVDAAAALGALDGGGDDAGSDVGGASEVDVQSPRTR